MTRQNIFPSPFLLSASPSYYQHLRVVEWFWPGLMISSLVHTTSFFFSSQVDCYVTKRLQLFFWLPHSWCGLSMKSSRYYSSFNVYLEVSCEGPGFTRVQKDWDKKYSHEFDFYYRRCFCLAIRSSGLSPLLLTAKCLLSTSKTLSTMTKEEQRLVKTQRKIRTGKSNA